MISTVGGTRPALYTERVVGPSDGGVPKSEEKKEGSGSHPELAVSSQPPKASGALVATLGIVDLVSVASEDEEGAEETRVQAQPPNFPELAEAFIPVGEVMRTTPKIGIAAISTAIVADDSITAEGPVARKRPAATDDDDDSDNITARGRPQRLPRLDSRPPDEDSVRPTALIPSTEGERPAPVGRSAAHGVRRGAGAAAAHAELFDPHSDSGLRRTEENLPSGDQPILGLPLSSSGHRPAAFDAPGSNEPFFVDAAQRAAPRDAPYPSGVNSQAPWHAPAPPSFSHPGVARGGPDRFSSFSSRYDVRVVIVAVLSFAIPFGLFLYLYNLLAQ